MRVASKIVFVCTLLCVSALGCADATPVGQPCQFNELPCDTDGSPCGFRQNEWYIDSANKQCPDKICTVYHLADGTPESAPKDPTTPCDAQGLPTGCVPQAQVDQAMYCTCKCAIDGKQTADTCSCSDGFECTQFVTGVSYCVRQGS